MLDKPKTRKRQRPQNIPKIIDIPINWKRTEISTTNGMRESYYIIPDEQESDKPKSYIKILKKGLRGKKQKL